MSLPIFEDCRGWRWGLGSSVLACWWTRGTKKRGVPTMEEMQREGTVAVIRKDDAGAWEVYVDFGPVGAALSPRSFRPNQITALEPPPNHPC